MSSKFKKIIAYILICTMVMTMNINVFAATEVPASTGPTAESEPPESEVSAIGTDTVYHINPIYSGEIGPEDLNQGSEYTASTFSDPEYLTDESVIIETIRQAMTERSETFTVYYTKDSNLEEAELNDWINQAVTETGQPNQGDYLKFQYGGCQIGWSTTTYSTGKREFDITFTFTYYTTAEQEAEVDAKVTSLLKGLDDSYSDYEKTKIIYDYICNNVTYDYENLDDGSYMLKYTAYAALIDRTAVCQGYACLLYRLLREAGVDVRIISGTGNGEKHAWNIIKIGDVYYCADSTWDRSCVEAGVDYKYFLKGTENFTDHVSEAEYTAAEFTAKYPASADDYNPATGSCGDKLTWYLDEDGVLTISGTGEMYDYRPENTNLIPFDTEPPWGEYYDKIGTLVIEEGVTTISDYAFYGGSHIAGSVVIPETVVSIGDKAFYGCDNIERITVLNKDCVITSILATHVLSRIIEGYLGSTAQAYAEEEGFDFVMIHDHEWEQAYVISKADCESDGRASYKCAIEGCDAEKEEALPALGHSYGEWYLNKVSTATEEGSYKRKCENCSSGYEEKSAGLDPDVKAGGFCGSDLTWRLNFYGTLTISGIGEMKNYSAKAFDDYNYLTTAPWGTYAEELQALVIEEGITAIGSDAFRGCENLSGKLVIPDTVTVIGDYSFNDCSGFTGDLIIPDSVTEVLWNAFEGCSGFDGTLKLSENMTEVCYESFSDCSSLTGGLVIPESVTEIGREAFYNCRKMDGKLMLHDDIVSIGKSAFSNCMSLTGELDLPSGLTVIENYSFRNCSGFTGQLMIPEGVTSIGDYAFESCSGFVGELVIPEGVTSIGSYAFRLCSGFTRLKLPDTLTKINKGAFEYNRIEGTVVIPANVSLIGAGAFVTNYYLNNKIEEIIIMNPECVIEDGSAAIMEPTVVVGYAESTAQQYAAAKGLVFRCIEHNWDSEYTLDTEPTCSTKGQKSIHCTACGSIKPDSEAELDIVPEAHDLTAEITAPTCTEGGYTIHTCSFCDYGYTDSETPKLGHTEEVIPAVEETCTSTGLTEGLKCSVCGEVLTTQEEIEKKEHEFGEWIEDEAATCTKTGSEHRDCADCGAIETRETAKLDHSYTSVVTASTCTAGGYTTHKCNRCDDSYIDSETAKLGHSYTAYKTTTKAGFGTKGVQTATCRNDNCKSKKTKTIPALKIPTLSTTTYTFNNKAKKPAVTVKNTSATIISKSVSYASGRKNVGKYAVKVTVNTVDYKGTKTVYFKINPKGASSVKLTGAKKALTVKWAKPVSKYRKQMTGYQIKYSTSSKMKSAKTVTVKSTTATSKKISKLKSKKYYYVQVRTYKKIGSSYYYSGWSSTKKVKTK